MPRCDVCEEFVVALRVAVTVNGKGSHRGHITACNRQGESFGPCFTAHDVLAVLKVLSDWKAFELGHEVIAILA